ncbi:alpha/beta hydrolase [Bacteroides sedimenti]
MKKVIHFVLLLFFPISLMASLPDDKFHSSEQLLQYIMEGKGEQAHLMLSDNVKSLISVDQMNNLWKGLVAIAGDYQNKSEWKEQNVSGKTVYYCDLRFSHKTLRCNTAFDKNGLATTLNFVPSPLQAPPPMVYVNDSVMQEKGIKVVTGKFELPGTLCMPKGKTMVPVVILVSGSGANDRDETIGPNKPFRDLAHGLAKEGIASIRYDKRTLVYGNKSVPEGEEPSMENEYVQDVLSAVRLAKNISGVDSSRIFIVGHSQGAYLAPRLAQRCRDIKGIVMMSGNARHLADLLPEQIGYLYSLDSLTSEKKKQLDDLKVQVANVKKLGKKGFDSGIALPLGLPASYWKDINEYNQLKVAKSLKCPILILQGERDYQVTMTDFLLWHKNLNGRKNVSFRSYPKLNHLYMEGTGKSSPTEYFKPATIPDYVSQELAEWINKQK